MRKFLLIVIKIYQNFISPSLPARCRYYPTCSAYARTALNSHSLLKALWLIIKRLASCQPFGGSGLDFVPVPMYRYYFKQTKFCRSYVFIDHYDYKAWQNYMLLL